MKKACYNLKQVILIILITSIVSGITVGIICTGSNIDTSSKYQKLLENEKIKELLNVYLKLDDDYYEDIDKDAIIESAIEAMTENLDEDYTLYLDENTTNSINDKLNSKYEGIGITILNNTIVNVIKDSPASENDIKIGDKIISINDQDITNLSTDEINTLISSSDKNVKLKINRDSQDIVMTLTKREINYPYCEYYIISNTSIGYLSISVFGNDVYEEVVEALKYFDSQNYESLIIDLRNNSGGYLDETQKILNQFVKKGKELYYIETKNDITKVKDDTSESMDKPIIILINGQSASASEILASSLQYNNNAKLVGEKSYGKGKIQHIYTLTSGSTVKYTSAKWLTPEQICIDGIGLSPDYYIENEYITNSENITVIEKIIDRQLEYAVELLNQ